MKRLSKTQRILLWLVLLAPILAFLTSEVTYPGRVAPPEGAKNLSSFLAQRAQLSQAARFELGGSNYLKIVGKMPLSLAVPSGPPVYIFNANGELVEWIRERGDNSRYKRIWAKGSNLVVVNLNAPEGWLELFEE